MVSNGYGQYIWLIFLNNCGSNFMITYDYTSGMYHGNMMGSGLTRLSLRHIGTRYILGEIFVICTGC